MRTIDSFVFADSVKVSLLYTYAAFISILSPRTQTFCASVSTYSPMSAGVFTRATRANSLHSRNVRCGPTKKRRETVIRKEAKDPEARWEKTTRWPFSRSPRASGLTQSGSACRLKTVTSWGAREHEQGSLFVPMAAIFPPKSRASINHALCYHLFVLLSVDVKRTRSFVW